MKMWFSVLVMSYAIVSCGQNRSRESRDLQPEVGIVPQVPDVVVSELPNVPDVGGGNPVVLATEEDFSFSFQGETLEAKIQANEARANVGVIVLKTLPKTILARLTYKSQLNGLAMIQPNGQLFCHERHHLETGMGLGAVKTVYKSVAGFVTMSWYANDSFLGKAAIEAAKGLAIVASREITSFEIAAPEVSETYSFHDSYNRILDMNEIGAEIAFTLLRCGAETLVRVADICDLSTGDVLKLKHGDKTSKVKVISLKLEGENIPIQDNE